MTAISPQEEQSPYLNASIVTADNLVTVATMLSARELSQLDLPEIERLSNEVARVVPAGNVPGIILSGLTRLQSRTIDQKESGKHIELLFRGVRQSLDRAIYHTFFAGPAAVLYGYQVLLKLAGKDPAAAFEEGTWQFYLEFALREDSARHANETMGFQTYLLRSQLRTLSDADQLAAWMLTAVETLYELPAMLANEWRERVLLRLLAEAATTQKAKNADAYNKLYREWETQRPYKSPADVRYADYRRRKFDEFWQPHYDALNRKTQQQFLDALAHLEQTSLPAYQRQMSWLAHLDPGAHREIRLHYPMEAAKLAVIYQGRYYLIPITELHTAQAVRATAAAIIEHKPKHAPASLDSVLVTASRTEHANLRKQLPLQTQQDLNDLQFAPVIINWDQHDSKKPLADIRGQAHRGVGDHALTIIRTDKSIVFDQSHIFFDGAWGAVVAEVMTNKAIHHIERISTQSPAAAGAVPHSLTLKAPDKLIKLMEKQHIGLEVSAENVQIKLSSILSLRRALKQRSELAQITVNDLFILYRALHGLLYTPSAHVREALNALAKDRRAAVKQAYQSTADALEKMYHKNPAILIPIDASRHDPRERLFPTTFRNPLTDFYDIHRSTLEAYYQAEAENSRTADKAFREAQMVYLRMIGGFGELLNRYKEIALQGQSTSTASIKFLAHMPSALQSMLDNIPGRFDVLNEVIKGEEVFSNIGQVARGSTLRRFITAKDDNQQKTLAWGVLTDDDGVVHISLRDFRPHITDLFAAGHGELAELIVKDYLDAFVFGFNKYVSELKEITIAGSARKRGLFG
ncbi:MAG: hypothetical protein OHK0046_13090 [Anaerolineae bacterium]